MKTYEMSERNRRTPRKGSTIALGVAVVAMGMYGPGIIEGKRSSVKPIEVPAHARQLRLAQGPGWLVPRGDVARVSCGEETRTQGFANHEEYVNDPTKIILRAHRLGEVIVECRNADASIPVHYFDTAGS